MIDALPVVRRRPRWRWPIHTLLKLAHRTRPGQTLRVVSPTHPNSSRREYFEFGLFSFAMSAGLKPSSDRDWRINSYLNVRPIFLCHLFSSLTTFQWPCPMPHYPGGRQRQNRACLEQCLILQFVSPDFFKVFSKSVHFFWKIAIFETFDR